MVTYKGREVEKTSVNIPLDQIELMEQTGRMEVIATSTKDLLEVRKPGYPTWQYVGYIKLKAA